MLSFDANPCPAVQSIFATAIRSIFDRVAHGTKGKNIVLMRFRAHSIRLTVGERLFPNTIPQQYTRTHLAPVGETLQLEDFSFDKGLQERLEL